MSYDEGLYAWVQEAMESLGRVSMRKMMGGATLYLDGNDRVSRAPHGSALSGGQGGPIIFAILVDDGLWLKSDAEADAIWDGQGCEKFTVAFRDGKVDVMNYRRAPLDVYDDPEAMRRWASLAVEAGTRAAAKKRPRASPRRRPGPQGE